MKIDALKAVHGVPYSEIHQIIRNLFAAAKKARSYAERYDVDRRFVSKYFLLDRSWERRILGFYEELKVRDVPLVYADICGRARWDYSPGVESYSFSLQPLGQFTHLFHHKSAHPIEGNIFSTMDFSRLIREMNKRLHRPFLVTFEPIAGLNRYTPVSDASIRVVYGILEKRLAEVVDILLPGGFIFLGTPIQWYDIADFFNGKPQEEYGSTLRMKALCKELRCSLCVRPSILGPYWLLRKYKNAR